MKQDTALTFASAPSAEAIAATRERWASYHESMHVSGPARPFVIVTPLGLAERDRIDQLFDELGVAVVARHPVPDWPAASTLLYARTDGDERLTVALAFEALWRAIVLDARAERWDLSGMDDFTRVVGAKPALHARLGIVRVRLEIPAVQIANDGIVRLRALHVPDPERLETESRLLDLLWRP